MTLRRHHQRTAAVLFLTIAVGGILSIGTGQGTGPCANGRRPGEPGAAASAATTARPRLPCHGVVPPRDALPNAPARESPREFPRHRDSVDGSSPLAQRFPSGHAPARAERVAQTERGERAQHGGHPVAAVGERRPCHSGSDAEPRRAHGGCCCNHAPGLSAPCRCDHSSAMARGATDPAVLPRMARVPYPLDIPETVTEIDARKRSLGRAPDDPPPILPA